MATQLAHDIAGLDKRVETLKVSLRKFAEPSDLEELLRHIHGPGWTTPAEYILVSAAIDHIATEVQTLTHFKQALIKGAAEVGRG